MIELLSTLPYQAMQPTARLAHDAFLYENTFIGGPDALASGG